MNKGNDFELLQGYFIEYPRLFLSTKDGLLYRVSDSGHLLLSERLIAGYDIRDNPKNGTMRYDVYVKYHEH